MLLPEPSCYEVVAMIASRARYDCAIVMLYLGLNSVVSRRLDFKPESLCHLAFNTLKPRQKWPPFRRRYFQTHFLEWKCISIEISLKFVPKGPVNNIPALVQMMAWRRPGDKPLSEPMMINLLTHICVTRPQWVKPECLCHLVFNLCIARVLHAHAKIIDMRKGTSKKICHLMVITICLFEYAA